MVAPSRQLSEAGCMKSEQKDRAYQTGFGMGREILSTETWHSNTWGVDDIRDNTDQKYILALHLVDNT